MVRDVFISYKTEDREAAERLCSTLERQNISCWMAPRDISPGREWAEAIVDGLKKSKSFVVLLSSHSVSAKQISRETELADKQNIKIMTFRLEDVEPPQELLYFLGNVQWLDAFDGRFDAAAARLADVIRDRPSGPQPVAKFDSAPASPPPPPTQQPAMAGPATGEAQKNPYLIPGLAGGAIVLLGIGLWFAFSGGGAGEKKPEAKPPAPVVGGTTDTTTEEVRQFAKRFLDDRDAGRYEAAWADYTEAFRKRQNETAWEQDTEKRNKEHGGIARHEYRECKSPRENQFVCEYTLVYKDGAQLKNVLEIVRMTTDNSLAISGGNVLAPR